MYLINPVLNGTTYDTMTNENVANVMEQCRENKTRVHIHYGDTHTCEYWSDVETGTIGRSMGPMKIPIIVHNARSMGGSGILTRCVLKITTTRKPFTVLYEKTLTS